MSALACAAAAAAVAYIPGREFQREHTMSGGKFTFDSSSTGNGRMFCNEKHSDASWNVVSAFSMKVWIRVVFNERNVVLLYNNINY